MAAFRQAYRSPPCPRPRSAPLRRSLLLLAVLATVVVPTAAGAEDPSQIWFPVQMTDQVDYTDSWGDPRGGGRAHTGIDIMAPQMHQVYAAVDGSIDAYEGDCRRGEYCSSYYLLLAGEDGRSYFYVHLNNDTPGRPNGCDGIGGIESAFAPRLVDEYGARGTLEGVRVERGEHIAYNGSSGNAGCGTDHTHFEIWEGHGWGAPKINPYDELRAAEAAGNVWGPEGAPPPPEPYDRVAGEDRLRTAIALSQEAFAQADAAVIAPAMVYPEALVASPLAATLDAPVLLTWDHHSETRDLLDDAVVEELHRLEVSYVVIVGSPERLGPELEQQLQDKAGIPPDAIRRIGGEDRYALSRNVADQILAYHGHASTHPAEEAEAEATLVPLSEDAETAERAPLSPIVALGEHEIDNRGWPDALAASVLAARQRVPVLLTRPDDLPADTRAVLEHEAIGEVRIVGGPAAVSPAVEEEIRDEVGRATRRLEGPTRYGTSLAVAEEYGGEDGVSLERLLVATGRNFPDALAAGPAVGALDRVLILVHGDDPDGSPSSYDWVRDRAEAIRRVSSVGGPAAVAPEVLERVAAVANDANG